ncbi:MAG: PQQ-binding-like beta-propeller repeat protein [Clostridiaceae bacterium]|jgi:outer membrane protein assembly factor BamB|nr:PQQ-binding-like beta-propeller repeat protein [Clostridiaceae bacterium]
MRNNKGKAFMLIVPLILLVVLIIVYRIYERNLPEQKNTETTIQTIAPTATLEPTPESTAAPTPTPTPTPTPAPVADNAGNSSGDKVKYQVYIGTDQISNYKGKEQIVFGAPEVYDMVDGITTFRGDNYRSGAAFGTRSVVEEKLEIVWSYDELTIVDPQWPGVGWTGQPLIVRWPEEVRKVMNLNQEFKNKDFVEVIQAALDGNIYFLDLETGKPTRPHITTGFPIKGSPFVDPRGYPLLYSGMGINELKSGKTTPWKYRIFSLIDQKEIFSLPGKDPVTTRTWGAFDSTGLVHAETDTLFQCGENGILYKIKLNTQFDPDKGEISINPEIVKYKYQNLYTSRLGIEVSPAIYRDLIYFADNGGMLQCVDINTLQPKWAFNVGDDTDSTPVIEETSDGVYLYTGNEVDSQGAVGKSTVRKINAITGEQIWSRSYECFNNNGINGGVLSAPTVGTGDIEGLVIFNITRTGTEWGGKLVALDKKTGQEVWTKTLRHYGWSSPTVFQSDEGKSYMIFCDSQGNMFLMDPKTGETLDTVSVERNVEASPAIYNDMIVVGSYARKIFGVRVK